MNSQENLIVYQKARAWWAFCSVILLLSPFMIDALLFTDDFVLRIRTNLGAVGLVGIGVAWWIFASWPDAISVVRAQRTTLSLGDGFLIFPNGDAEELTAIQTVLIRQRRLRAPHVVVSSARGVQKIVTAFQRIGRRADPDRVMRQIMAAKHSLTNPR